MFNKNLREYATVGFIVALALAGVALLVSLPATVGAQEPDDGISGQAAVGTVFTYHSIDSNYKYCSAISAADMDRDGDMDVLSSSQEGTGAIHWWEGRGNGQAFYKNVIDSGSYLGATSFYAVDGNDDGDLDVAAISTTYNKFATYFNQGDGSWDRWDPWPKSYTVSTLSPVGVERSGTHYILVGSTTNLPGARGIIIEPFPGYPLVGKRIADLQYISALYPDDMDRDGEIDYVATSKYKNQIVWYASRDPAIVGPYTVDSTFSRPIWVQTGDLDRDGDPDVVAASDTKGLFWWENTDSKGTSWTRHRITQQEFYVAPSLHLVDLDNDGDLDLTAATKNQMVLWENLGAPTQAANWIRHLLDTNTYAFGNSYALFPADVNGDGQMDIVGCDLDLQASAASQPGRRLGWWENEHEMPSADQIAFAIQDIDNTLTGAWGVDVADFNGDGRLDVAAAGYGAGGTTGETRWWRNIAGTPLSWNKAFSAAFDKGRGVTAYSTARGRPRYLVSGNAYTGEAREFYGNDWDWTSTGQSARLSGLGDTYMSAVADLDDDGTLDIIGASAQNDDVVWRDGATGTQSKIEDNCDGARAVRPGDIDGDGDLDVAAACQNEHYIYRWWQGDYGGSRWSGKLRYTSLLCSGATDVECGDINIDGRVEMVAARPGPPKGIAWLEVVDPDVYEPFGWVTTNFTGTEYIELADMDRDGDLDVMSTSNQRDELIWFEHKITTTSSSSGYSGYFTPHTLDENIDVREVAVGDISGDGAPDIVIAAQNQNLVRWYEQQVPVELSVMYKQVDPSSPASTGVISTGQSIPYEIQISNNALNGATADVLVVDTWEPSYAVVDASSDRDCVTDISQGVMTCTLSVEAGKYEYVNVVITPSLLFGGYITNTARIVPVGPFWNTTPYNDSDQAAPVEVQRDPSICDLLVAAGYVPSGSPYPGGRFSYSVMVANQGPKSPASATLNNQWSPAIAIAGFDILSVTLASSSLSAMTASADYDCTTDATNGEVSCQFDNLIQDVPITVTVGVATSEHFTDILECAVTLTGADEGNPANNQTYPVRVGSRPFEKVYLPVIMKNH